MRRPLSLVFLLPAVLIGAQRAEAAGHPEITVVPVGPGRIEKGTREMSYRLPMGPRGALPQPVVFVGQQPWPPVSITFTIAGQELPVWKLRTQPITYTIKPNIIESNPDYANNRLTMQIDVDIAAEDVPVVLSGLPDPILLHKGTQNVSWELPPINPENNRPRAIVLEGQLQQVPARMKFTIAGRELPPWQLQPYPTAYVINKDTVNANPEYGKDRLAFKISLDTAAEAAKLTVLGMPDPLLLNETTNGPLIDLAQAAAEPEVKAYLFALTTEVGGDKETARKEYDRLRAAQNARVGRFARRGLRMLSYDLRKHKLSGNFMEHYRWGLYLQQCGLYSAAFKEFEECRVLFPWHGNSQFRAGEAFDRMGGPVYRVLDYMERTGEAAKVTDPNDWYVLVTILRSRGGKTLSGAEVREIKNRWLVVEEMVWAATDGAVRITTSFFDVDSEQDQAYALREGGMYAPTDDIVQARGWFDGVVSVVPRLPDEADARPRTIGGDAGPGGAALSCLFHDARWQDFLAACYDQLSWAARTGEVGPGVPVGEQAIGCGHGPAPHDGYAYRAALRYYFTRPMSRRLKITDAAVPDSAVRLWKIEGPYPVQAAPPADGPPSHHVLDALPAGAPQTTVRIVSDGDFIDLAKVFPGAGWARAQATCWVYSPEDREVRMWLGRNDGMAVWVNGLCIHEGRYYSAGRYEDKNLVDTIASYAGLKRGWNELRVVVESWPAPRDKGWGFSVRFCLWDNRPVPGIAYANRKPDRHLVPRFVPPESGLYYSWQAVKADYHAALPALAAADLEKITAVKGLRVAGALDTPDGWAAITAPRRTPSPTYRTLTQPWRPGRDRDVVLNNVLDGAREACAAYRYRKNGKDHDLLILKPEAVEAYLTLLNEPTSAADLFEGRPPADRVLGYVVVPAGSSNRTLLVVDALLGDAAGADTSGWPVDEEDLLTPFGQRVPNAAFEQMGPHAP